MCDTIILDADYSASALSSLFAAPEIPIYATEGITWIAKSINLAIQAAKASAISIFTPQILVNSLTSDVIATAEARKYYSV